MHFQVCLFVLCWWWLLIFGLLRIFLHLNLWGLFGLLFLMISRRRNGAFRHVPPLESYLSLIGFSFGCLNCLPYCFGLSFLLLIWLRLECFGLDWLFILVRYQLSILGSFSNVKVTIRKNLLKLEKNLVLIFIIKNKMQPTSNQIYMKLTPQNEIHPTELLNDF